MLRLSLSVPLLLLAAGPSQTEGLVRKPERPLLGFSTWNYFADDINETLIVEISQAMANNGLQAAGYNSINIDDAWAAVS